MRLMIDGWNSLFCLVEMLGIDLQVSFKEGKIRRKLNKKEIKEGREKLIEFLSKNLPEWEKEHGIEGISVIFDSCRDDKKLKRLRTKRRNGISFKFRRSADKYIGDYATIDDLVVTSDKGLKEILTEKGIGVVSTSEFLDGFEASFNFEK